MKAGLLKAISSGVKDIICCSDAKSLVDAITGTKTVTPIRGILHDLGVLSSSFSSISFHFIAHSCNDPADKLAKNALSVKLYDSKHHFLFNPVRNPPLEDIQTSFFSPQSLFTYALPGICSLMSSLLDFDNQRICLGSMTTLWIQYGNTGVLSFCLNSIPGYSANLAKLISQDVVIRANSSSLLDLTHWCLPVTTVCAQKPSYLVDSSLLCSSWSRTCMYSEREGASTEPYKLGLKLHSYLSGAVIDVTHSSSQSHHQSLSPTSANVIARLFLKWNLPKLEDCSPLVFCFYKRLIKFPHVQGHERSIIDDAGSSSSHSAIVSFVASASLLIAETLALRNAMISARQCGINALLICSEFQIFINLVKSRGRHLEIVVLLNDIHLLSTLSAVKFKFIARLVNYRADLCGQANSISNVLNV
ncbi:Ribonuclease H-like domain protein [Raphanus sativus]|nr:Ribonuclease H-like domain protein [Raphanus sativus]